jgi:hypothetical protein
MKTALSLLGLLSVGAFVLAGTTGCEVACTDDEETGGTKCESTSLTYFTDPATEFDKSAAWSAGGTVTIDGEFGEITVSSGDADTVKAHFVPFSYRAYDKKDDAMRDIHEFVQGDVVANGAGADVSTWMAEGTHGSNAGAHIHVLLPPNFDGALVVKNRGGGSVSSHREFDVNISFVGQAKSLDVRTTSKLGDCRIAGAASVTSSEAHCGSLVQLHDVSDFVNVSTKFGTVIGKAIDVKLASVSAAGGGTLRSEDGSIVLSLPAAGTYSVQAQASAGGSVQVGGQPADCSLEVAAESSKTLSCGADGPNYAVTAGLDSVGDSNVELRFH